MWSNNSPPPSPHAEPTDSLSPSLGPPSFRRKRTKTRKPKFLSLRHQLTPQLVKRPLSYYHPPDLHDDHSVAFLFSSDGGATSTLNGLLQDDSFSPPSLTWPTLDGDNGSSLLRKAMRRSKEESEGSEEMWLCYSDVTSYCSSSSAIVKEEARDCDGRGMSCATTFSCLSLKLDYRGILSAWSDKGSPYVALQTPQHLPPLLHHVLPANSPKVSSDGNENSVVENAWEVVENEGKMEVKDKKLGEREASLLRYKEKKQHRRFAKCVRYEVRKLNADKRPRVKGRFVKEAREV